MRAVDRVAVEDVGLSLLQMMENAGRTLAEMASAFAEDGPVVVVAGNGGNGGGGLCAGRHLANHGRAVRVVLDRDPADLTGAAATQHRILRETDATVGTDESGLDDAALVVDAVVGYGLTGALRGRARHLVEAVGEATVPTLSLDVPSGVDATTGERPGVSVDADATLTLALPKTGLGDVGALWLADIGVPAGVYDRLDVDYDQPFDGRARVRLFPRTPTP